MKIIGLLGGMSWESSVEYYRIINEEVRLRLGGLHSAESVMYSVDFAQIEQLQQEGRWEEAAVRLTRAACCLEKAGADFVLICTNTMHKVAEAVQAGIQIPLLHIADATAETVRQAGVRRVGLLGTRFTMEEAFYRGRLEERYELEVLVPPAHEREVVHCVIYDELCLGQLVSASRSHFVNIIEGLVERGAEGVILGCTEIGLLVGEEDSPVPLFDTTRIHAEAAVTAALSG